VKVIVTKHVATAPVPDRVQAPEGVNATVPVGVVAPVVLTSVTVAVQVVGWPITTVVGRQATVVVVEFTPTDIVKGAALTACVRSPT
jgi:hypothetical protein